MEQNESKTEIYGTEKRINVNKEHLSIADVKLIAKNTCHFSAIKDYNVFVIKDKMLGYMADYWRLTIQVQTEKDETKILKYFIKAIPINNQAKAEMIKSLNLFDKELYFYDVIKREIESVEIRPWSPTFIVSVKNASVFEDLEYLNFKVRNKFVSFDRLHTFQALQTLARFHATSIIYEEKKSKELNKMWRIYGHFQRYLDKGGVSMTHPWYMQCMLGALEAISTHSKYKDNKSKLEMIKSCWEDVWESNIALCDISLDYRNVICHADLWNNNIMFHYKDVDNMIPDDCVFVDFQAVRFQPPAGDVMLLLYCNLDPEYREENMSMFLNYYYQQLKDHLSSQEISIDNIMSYQQFAESCEQQRKWGLIMSACLMPTVWIDDGLIAKIFSDTAKYKDILTENKGAFIIKMMESDEIYKKNILNIFDEVVDKYCLKPIY